MINKVKKFDDFEYSDRNNGLNEEEGILGSLASGVGSVFKGIGKGVDFMLPAVEPAFKRWLTSTILGKWGIIDDSTFSFIVQNVIKLIPVKDYTGILMGDKLNAEYLSPLLAEATMQMITEKGIDTILEPIAKAVGLDPAGFAYKTFVERVQLLMKDREKFKASLVGIFKFLGSIEVNFGEFAEDQDPATQKKIAGDIYSQLAQENPAFAKKYKKEMEENGSSGLGGFLSGLGKVFSQDKIKHD
jgi:hypothetical protein